MEKKEYRIISSDDPQSKPMSHMFYVKEILKSQETLNITAGTTSSELALRIATTLQRLKYVSIENIQTSTIVEEGQRIIKLVVKVKKTPEFDKLYKEYEDKKKAREEQLKKDKESEINE